MLGAALKRAGTGGQPQHLFLAQGTTSLLASQGPALTQLWTGRQAGGDTGRICRRRWCREPVSGERHCMLTAREPAEQSHLDWIQLHAAAISSHLLFCMGAITLAQDTTAIFPDIHSTQTYLSVDAVPCMSLRSVGTGQGQGARLPSLKLCFSGQCGCNCLGFSSTMILCLPSDAVLSLQV